MKFFKSKVFVLATMLAIVTIFSGCVKQLGVHDNGVQGKKNIEKKFLLTYSNIALASYSDALKDAKQLNKAIEKFVENPNLMNFDLVKAMWLKSRESYGQTEAFRLSNGPIDAEDGWIAKAYGNLEGQINAWPLDENIIDYTIDADVNKTSGNIIDTKGDLKLGGEDSSVVNVKNITIDSLTALNENGGEANVTTGYHAIEFLLWGQDQDYSNMLKDSITYGAMVAGQRPLSDFTTNKNAKRRLDYLKASGSKLVSDLKTVTSAWRKNIQGNKGLYRAALLGKLIGKDKNKNIPKDVALKQIFTGLGTFSKSELANERIAVAVLTPSEEDEHSCFSDNTHRDIAQNYQGIKNILLGTYDGKDFGISIIDTLNKQKREEILNLMASIEDKIAKIDAVARTSRHFDYQIHPNDPQVKVIVKLKNQLRKLGDEMVNIAKANGIKLTTDDVTDPEETKI